MQLSAICVYIERVRVGLMYYGGLVMSRERNASRLGAATIMEGSWFQAIIVRGKKDNL